MIYDELIEIAEEIFNEKIDLNINLTTLPLIVLVYKGILAIEELREIGEEWNKRELKSKYRGSNNNG